MLKLRSRLTYANVIATLALFIALGGASYAALKVHKNSVGTKQLKALAVTEAKVHDDAITAGKIQDGAITGAEVQDGAITGPNIQDGAITGAKVQDASIPTSKLSGLTGPGGTIASGVTLRGVFSPNISTTGSPTDSAAAGQGVSFGGYQLATRPVANLVLPGSSPTNACPGSPASPEAASGALCVYVAKTSPTNGQIFVFDPSTTSGGSGITGYMSSGITSAFGDGKVSVLGFSISYNGTSTGPSVAIQGTWAVTG